MDESSFTGELEPRHKYVKSLVTGAEGFDHVDNVVYMGTLVRSGHGRVSDFISFFGFYLFCVR